ncbi:hypothetical protein [Sorangium sp. So ce363]|uniref:hypothetical protein n=1 Tax=Sorangium sp. So ce363 TaxID=3133304 RepID=UPI003F5DD6D6
MTKPTPPDEGRARQQGSTRVGDALDRQGPRHGQRSPWPWVRRFLGELHPHVRRFLVPYCVIVAAVLFRVPPKLVTPVIEQRGALASAAAHAVPITLVFLLSMAPQAFVLWVFFRRPPQDRPPAAGSSRLKPMSRGGLLIAVGLMVSTFLTVWGVALWYAVHGNEHTDLLYKAGCSFIVFLMLILGTLLTILQSWESAERPSRDEAVYPDIGRLRALEAEWIQARRRAANLKHEAAGDGDPRGAHLIGLSLSGGGIRSATICLGFLKGLATVPTKSGEVILKYVDYMSSVSGGGWAGGALTARTSGPHPEGDADRERRFDPQEAASWNRLLDRIRLRGDYLIPGGIGLTANTLQPLLMIFVGAIANALSLLTAGFAAIVFLHHSSARSPKAFLARVVEHGVTAVVCHVDGARSLFFTTASVESGTLPDAIARHLPVLDLLVFVLALMGGVLLAALLVMYLGILFSWPSVHEAGTWLAARAALLVVLTWGSLLALRADPLLTLLVLCAALAVALAVLLSRLKREQLLAVIGVAISGQVFALRFTDLYDVVKGVTSTWASMLQWLIFAPIEFARSIDGLVHVPVQRDPMKVVELTFGATLCLVFIGLSFLTSRNYAGINRFWANQIRRAYLSLPGDSGRAASDSPSAWPLAALRPSNESRVERTYAADPAPWNLGGPRRGAPLHVVTATVNTPGSDDPVLYKRGTARFEFSPYAVGGPATGWGPAEAYGDALTLAHSIAISAAAVNSQGGTLIPRWARVVLTMLNCGLGVWVRNPRFARRAGKQLVLFRRWAHFWSAYHVKEIFARNKESDTLVFVSDGGHHDNLGLTTLVERECELILCIDAGADPEWTCDELAKAARILRVDRGLNFELKREDLERVRPQDPRGTWEQRTPSTPILVGKFKPDPGAKTEATKEVTVVYVKAGLLPGLPLDVQRYAESHPEFPHQTTADQFFDEAQFEAYRLLGEALAHEVVRTLDDATGSAGQSWASTVEDLRPEPRAVGPGDVAGRAAGEAVPGR